MGLATVQNLGNTRYSLTLQTMTERQAQKALASGQIAAFVVIPEGFELKLNRKEFSLTEKYPNPWALYKETMGVKPSDITWTVDDPKVASVDENGVVSAVGKGWTTVRASIGDQTASCKVNVTFDPKPAKEPTYKISNTDVTLYVGDPTMGSFRITLTDKDGVTVDAEWTVSDEGYVTISNRNVTAV
jgi:hypothetical protein